VEYENTQEENSDLLAISIHKQKPTYTLFTISNRSKYYKLYNFQEMLINFDFKVDFIYIYTIDIKKSNNVGELNSKKNVYISRPSSFSPGFTGLIYIYTYLPYRYIFREFFFLSLYINTPFFHHIVISTFTHLIILYKIQMFNFFIFIYFWVNESWYPCDSFTQYQTVLRPEKDCIGPKNKPRTDRR
jgi:hypothetical protein